MPLGEQEGLLIGAGVTLSLATTYFYRQRQTLPFKVQQDNAADAGVHGCKQHVSSSCVRVHDGACTRITQLPCSRSLLFACTLCSGHTSWHGLSWALASYWPCRPATTRWQIHCARAAWQVHGRCCEPCLHALRPVIQ